MALVPLVGGLAMVAAYLDAKFNLRSDIAQIHCARNQGKHWQQLCEEYGEDDWSYYHLIHKTYGKNEYDEALLFEDRSWTYSQFRGEIGRLAIAFQKMGIANRTVVGMYINNSPEFMFTWWALYKIGAIPSPVNTSITEEPLRHCLRVSDSKFLITSYELFEAANRSLADRDDVGVLGKVIIYDYDTYPSVPLHDKVMLLVQEQLDPLHPSMAAWPKESRPKVGPQDTSQYLFTSGTTGLPKALIWPVGHANMGGSRYRWPMMFEKPRRTYICTPLFHGGATFALLPSTFALGGTIILVRKFSRKNFWHDMRRTRANMMFYIGEMIRYLVQSPPDPLHPDETKGHCLEVIFGLGLTAPVWRQFRDRFGVKWIAEYYGASEGTTAISNSNFSNERGVAKVAHWGPLMRSKWLGQKTTYIIRIDMETMEVIRNPETGKCIQCEYGEVGEAIMRIVPPLQRSHDYVGEQGRKATKEKLITNVFEEGDLFWRLGDALSMDNEGFVSFHDRLGDTFRAKGHNVSTAEVEMAFIHHPTIAAANVFAVPMSRYGYEGQVGCAALTFKPISTSPSIAASTTSVSQPTDAHTDVSALLPTITTLESYLLATGLAPYAVPRFLRVLISSSTDLGNLDAEDAGSERTSLIFKKLKTGLRREGLTKVQESRDMWFWLEREGGGYKVLEEGVREGILGGKARL